MEFYCPIAGQRGTTQFFDGRDLVIHTPVADRLHTLFSPREIHGQRKNDFLSGKRTVHVGEPIRAHAASDARWNCNPRRIRTSYHTHALDCRWSGNVGDT